MYGKIFASLYQGTLRGNAHAILVFTNLIACADRHGNCDKHWRAISDEVGLPVDQVRQAIAFLMQPDPESRSREHGGARLVTLSDDRGWGWSIVNYRKYRDIRNEEDRTEQNRAAQERARSHRAYSKKVSQRQPASAGDASKSANADGEGDAQAEGDAADGASASNARARIEANDERQEMPKATRSHPAPHPGASPPPIVDPGERQPAGLFDPSPPVPVKVAGTDAEEWRFKVRHEPWALALLDAGGKIGEKNWRAWRGLIDRAFAGNPETCAAAAVRLPAGERWPDAVEDAARQVAAPTPAELAKAASMAKYANHKTPPAPRTAP